MLGGAALLALQAAALASHDRARRGARRGLRGDGDHRLLARGAERPQDRRTGSAALGIAGGIAVLAARRRRGRGRLDVRGSTFWASSLGFMIWVLVDRRPISSAS